MDDANAKLKTLTIVKVIYILGYIVNTIIMFVKLLSSNISFVIFANSLISGGITIAILSWITYTIKKIISLETPTTIIGISDPTKDTDQDQDTTSSLMD